MAASRVGVVTEEEKQFLLERYLDIVWVDDVTEVKCVRCDRVPIYHYVSNCQHIFCRNCRNVFSDGGQWRCPSCKEYVTQLTDQDFKLEDTIYQLTAHCPNKKYGCHYHGQLKTIPGHLRRCADTREAALPTEFKGITLDTVVTQMIILKEMIGEMRSEMEELKDKFETNRSQTETIADGFTTNLETMKHELHEPKDKMVNMEQVQKDVHMWKHQYKSNQDEIKKNNDDFVAELKLLKCDLNEQKEQSAVFKALLRDMQEFNAENERKWKSTEIMENELNELSNNMKALTQYLNKQKEQMANLEQVLKGFKEKESEEQRELKSQLEQQQTLINTYTTLVNTNANQVLEMNVTVEKIQAEVKELTRECDTECIQMIENNGELSKDIKVLRWDVQEQKEYMATVKPIIEDVTFRQEKCENKWNHIDQMEIKLDKSATEIKTLKQHLNNEELRTTNMEQILHERATRVALEVQQLQSQLQQQKTLTDTYTTEVDEQLEKLNVTMENMKSVETDLKENWDTKWKKVKKHMDDFNKDFHGQQQQMVEVKEREKRDASEMEQLKSQLQRQQTLTEELTQRLNEQKEQSDNVEQILKAAEERDAFEIEQLKSQLQQQHTLIDNNTAQFEPMIKQLSSVEAQVKRVIGESDKAEKETHLMATQLNQHEEMLNAMQITRMGLTLLPHETLRAMARVYIWKIRDIKRDDGTYDDPRDSEVFPLKGYHYGAKVQLDFDGLLRLHLIDYYNSNRPIDAQSMPTVTFVFSNKPHNIIRSLSFRFEDSLKYVNYIDDSSILLQSQFTHPTYLMSNGMQLSVYVEPPSMARSFFSNNGILYWKLDNYKERKQMEVDGLIEYQMSPYFYTSPHGYRVLITLHLKDETLGVGLRFLTGEFDSSLTEEFPHLFTMTIINHTAQSFNLVIRRENKRAYYTNFKFDAVSVSSLESDSYVKDDSLLIKAVIEPL